MSLSNDEKVETFLDSIKYFSIAHHLPGRIRIKASLLKAAQLRKVKSDDISEVADTLPGIHSCRVNMKGLSAVIEYDKNIIPPELWEEVANVEKFPATRAEVKEKLLALLENK